MRPNIPIEYYQELSKLIYFDKNIPKWNRSFKRQVKDKIAGKMAASGRIIRLTLNGIQKTITAHRLLWFMHYQEYPPLIIFHLDYNKDNNINSNLIGLDPRSNYKGVKWDIKNQKWCAIAYIDDQPNFLGYFDKENEAAKAWDQAIDGIYPNYKKNFNYDILKNQGLTVAERWSQYQ